MIRKPGKTVIVLSFAVSLLVGLAPAVLSSAEATKFIEERHHAMESIRDSMMELAAIAKKEAPFDAEVVKKNAANITERLLQAKSLFPEGTDQGDVETWAKPEIWSQPEGFTKAFERTRAAALAMQEVTEEADFGPALGSIGDGCRSCHEVYRRPKE